MVDQEALDRIRRIGGDGLVGRLAALFIADVPLRVARLHEAALAGDLANVLRTSHSIRGSAATLGGVKLVEACRTVEREALAGGVARGNVDELEIAVSALCEALRPYLGVAA